MKKEDATRIFNEINALFSFNDNSLKLFEVITSSCRINGDAILYIVPTFALVKECFQKFCKFNGIEPSSLEVNTLCLQNPKVVFSDIERLKYAIKLEKFKQIIFYDGYNSANYQFNLCNQGLEGMIKF